MALQLRRGSNSERLQFTPLAGELIVETDNWSVWVGDGNTPGGLMVTNSSSNTLDGLSDVTVTQPSEGQILKYNLIAQSWVNADDPIPTLNGLSDVSLAPQVNIGQVLSYNGTSWVNSDIATNLSDLSDVNLNTPVSGGQVLQYDFNTGKWINASITFTTSLSSLSDVMLTGIPTNGQVLQYNSATQRWVNGTISGGTGGISNVVEDTTPQLGGDLDLNNKNIIGIGGINITGSVTASGTIGNTVLSISGQNIVSASVTTDDLQIRHLNIGGEFTPTTPIVYSHKTSLARLYGTSELGLDETTTWLDINASKGTLSAKTSLSPGDVVSGIRFQGYNGTDYLTGSALRYSVPATADYLTGLPAGNLEVLVADNGNIQIFNFRHTGTFEAPVIQTGVYESTPLDTRPTGVKGMIIFDDATGRFQGFNGTTWVDLNT